MPKRKIILASTSPRRRELMQLTRLPFVVEASDYEENMALPLKPRALAKKLSRGKAEAVAKLHNHENAIVIGADTFIVLGEKLLGKPKNAADARRMLRAMSGKMHVVLTGISIIDTKSGKCISRAFESKVYFKKLTDQEIRNYVRSGEPLGKAGSYAMQGLGSVIVKKIEGEWTGIVGLPLLALSQELKKFGITIL